MLAGAATVAVACSSGEVVAVYGGPPIYPDASTDASSEGGAKDAGPDGPFAAYGGPPVDASFLQDSGATDAAKE